MTPAIIRSSAGSRRFRAFVSYAWRADSAFAPVIRAGLETLDTPLFGLPRSRVFCDQTDLEVNPTLWPTIQKAIRNSDSFILLASPAAAESSWVAKELEEWLTSCGANNLHIALTDGRVEWDPQATDFDWTTTTAIPPLLKGRFSDEPKIVDLRHLKQPTTLDHNDLALRTQLAEFAPLFGKTKREVLDTLLHESQRRLRWAVNAAVVLAILAMVAAVAAYRAIQAQRQTETQRMLAVEQKEEATRQRSAAVQARDLAQSRQLVAQSELLQVNQPARVELSTLLELESIRTARTPENDRALRETSSLLLASRFSTKSGRGLQRVALSPNGRWLAVGGQEKLTRVFDLSTAKQVAAISHTGWVWAICFSQDGQYLLSAGDDGTAIAIRLTAATEVMRLRGAKGVRTAVFSPHGQQVALGSYSDAAVYEFPSGRLVSRWEHRDAVFSVAFSRDGALLGTGSADHKARLFEIGQQQMGLALPHDEKVMDVKFSPTRDFMATASADGTVRGFDVGSVRERWRYVATKLVHRLDFSPDGARLAVASFDGITRVLNVDSGQEVSRFTHKGSVSAVAFSPDGLWVASASEDETARIFDASTGREIRRIGMSSAVQDVAWDGRTRLLAVGAQDGSVTVVDAAPSRDLAWRPKFSPMPPSVSPDGRWLLRGDAIGHLTVSAVEDGTAVDALEAMDCSLIACFSVDGRSLGRARRNSYVEIVSVPDAHLTFRRRIPNASGVLAVSTKAQYAIVAATPGGAMLFATSDESNIRELARDELVVRASFSPDGARFALAGSDGTVRVFALGTDQELWRARFKKPASAIAFSPDGTVLAAGSYDRTATLFDAHSGRERLRISEDAPVREVAIGPNQSWWAVGTEDGQVHIYESLTSHQWSQVDARGDYVSLAFGKLGRELVSAASTVDTLWMRKTMLLKEDLIASACASLSRNLTIAEFQLFLPDQPRRRTCVDLP